MLPCLSYLYIFEQVSALGFYHSSTCACPLAVSTRMPRRHLMLSMVHLELIIYSPVFQATSLEVTLDPSLSWNFSSTPYGSVSTSCWFHLPDIFSALIICVSVPLPEFKLQASQSLVFPPTNPSLSSYQELSFYSPSYLPQTQDFLSSVVTLEYIQINLPSCMLQMCLPQYCLEKKNKKRILKVPKDRINYTNRL